MHDRVKEAVIGAIRSDLKLSSDTSESDVLHECHHVLTKAVGQIIDVSFPDATQKQEHPIWDDMLLSCILSRIHETVLEGTLEVRPKPIQTTQPDKDVQPVLK